jgi:hypothetical protein
MYSRWSDDAPLVAQVKEWWESWKSFLDIRQAIVDCGYKPPSERHLRRMAAAWGWRRAEGWVRGSRAAAAEQSAFAEGTMMTNTPSADSASEPTDERFEARVSTLEAKYAAQYDRRLADAGLRKLAHDRAQVQDLLFAALHPPVIPHPVPRVTARFPHDMVLVLSDAHVGKYVDENTVGSGFIYNKGVFSEMAATLQQEVVDLADFYRYGRQPVRDLYIDFCGDNIDGSTMRAGQAFRVDLTVGEQIPYAAETFAHLVAGLSAYFRYVFVRGKIGNHGRPTGRLDDTLVFDNHEMRMLELLKALVRHVPNVDVVIKTTEYDVYQVGTQTVVSQHLHRVRANNKQSPIPAIKQFLEEQRRSIIGIDANLYIGAHFHQPFIHDFGGGRKIVGNGCWDGGDDFTCNVLAKAAGASQWLLVVDDERGLTSAHELLRSFQRIPVGDRILDVPALTTRATAREVA